MITHAFPKSPRVLTALPVYNEAGHVVEVLEAVQKFSRQIVVVDDGSSDGTAEILARRERCHSGLHVVRHPENRGYGAAIRTAFQYAIDNGYDVLVTIDCDGQHQPELIPHLSAAAQHADIVSGSRYLQSFSENTPPPADRQRVNREITAILNKTLGLELTDSFCGFKAYRVAALRRLELSEEGYAIPLEFWVQAVAKGLSIREFPVPLVYLDEERSFGGALDDAQRRLAHYLDVLANALQAVGWQDRMNCVAAR